MRKDNSNYCISFIVALVILVSGAIISAEDVIDSSQDKHLTDSTIFQDDILKLPVRTFEEILTIQNGVVEVPASGLNRGEFHLRGGRHTNIGYYLNGVPIRNEIIGDLTATISPHAIGQMQILSGNSSAVYGNANSGIISIFSPSGGSEYHGMVEAISDNIGGTGYDRNWYTISLNGPIPGLEKGRFWGMIEKRYFGDRNPSIKTANFLPSGDKTLPNNWQNGWSYHTRADYQVKPNLEITLTADIIKDEWQEYWHQYLFQPRHTPRYEDKNKSFSASIKHEINETTDYSLQGYYFESERFRGDGVVFKDYESYYRTVDGNAIYNPRFDFYWLFYEGDSVYASDLDGNVLPQDDSLVGYYEHYWADYLKLKSTQKGIQGDFNKLFTQNYSLSIGFNATKYTIRFFENLNATNQQDSISSSTRINRYGYDLYGNESDDLSFAQEAKRPIEIAAYLENYFNFGNLSANLGCRLDYLDIDGLVFNNPSNPYDPLGGIDQELDESDFKDTKTLTKIAPRLKIKFQFIPNLSISGSFGIYHQRPQFTDFYSSLAFIHSRITKGGSYYPFSLQDISFYNNHKYEFELRFNPTNDFKFNFVYLRNNAKNNAINQKTTAVPVAYDSYHVSDLSSHSQVIEFGVLFTPTRNMNLTLYYTLGESKDRSIWFNTASIIALKIDPYSYLPPLTLHDYDRTHSFTGILNFKTQGKEGVRINKAYPFENMSLSLIAAYNSGTPYTPIKKADEVVNINIDINPTGPHNSSRQPAQFILDVKLEKQIKVGNINISHFLLVKNLLNRENIQTVYMGTGQPDYTGFLTTPAGENNASNNSINPTTGLTYGEEYSYLYPLAERNAINYGRPRIIYFGLRASF